ncbi:MAG: hypothetical protein M3014_07650 [Chloroflexota bacterium]|nr:hypothetical protein [Chloroflexota bacterium]
MVGWVDEQSWGGPSAEVAVYAACGSAAGTVNIVRGAAGPQYGLKVTPLVGG